MGKVQFHPQFESKVFIHGYHYIVFKIPVKWAPDVELFSQGKYSKMSEHAKDTIMTYSGLSSKRRTADGKIITDMKLLALSRNPMMMEMWKSILYTSKSRSTADVEGEKMLQDMEVLSVPEVYGNPYIDLKEMAQL